MITDISQLDLSKKYTYADYLTWQFDEMVELIRGKVVRMSPAPETSHQKCSSNLHGLIWNYLHNKTCQVFSAPFDVRLPVGKKVEDTSSETVVQPDLSIICSPDKLDQKGCKGAPDWIIEILSKSTAQKDLKDKYELYERAGVQEYWIVHPAEGTVLVYRLNKQSTYQLVRSTPFTPPEHISVGLFPDFRLDLGEVFGE